MKYFLLFCLTILFENTCHAMEQARLSQHENLEREIFIRNFYKDYQFGYLQILQKTTAKNPLKQKVFASLIARGRRKYAILKSHINNLEDFDEYSLTELENIKVN